MQLNRFGKRGSPGMLYLGIGLLAVLLSYVFVQATHQARPDAQPHTPLHEAR
jgi:hypothetical protein